MGVEDDDGDLAVAEHGELVRLLHQTELPLGEGDLTIGLSEHIWKETHTIEHIYKNAYTFFVITLNFCKKNSLKKLVF